MDYERVLKHWEAPVKGKLTDFHGMILSESFRNLVRAKNKDKSGSTNGEDRHYTWDNGYM